MLNSTYLCSIIFFSFGILFYFKFNFRQGKSEVNNKKLLKTLLEGLDMDLPEELKSLDKPSTDPQKLS